MKQLAFYREGDRVELVEYSTKNGFHEIEWDDDTKPVKANPHIPPLDVSSLAVFVRSQGGWRNRRKARDMERSLEEEGAKVRFFEALETGVFEVPVAKYAELHRAFNSQVVQKATRFDSERQRFDLINIEPVLQDLAKMGINPDQAFAYLEHMVNTMETGHAGLWASPHVLDRLRPVAESMLVAFGAGVMGLLYGLEFGANPAVSEWWQNGQSQWILLGALGVFGGLIVWKSKS